jgi:hypothetical protein
MFKPFPDVQRMWASQAVCRLLAMIWTSGRHEGVHVDDIELAPDEPT